MRVPALLFLAIASALASDEDPTDVLIRLREQVLAHGDRIPNYTCVETVHRDRYEPAASAPNSCDAILARRRQSNFASLLRMTTSDRLRLDVAFVGNRELYSWAGAARFEQGEIDELIPDGAIGTGPYATMLLSTFEGRPPKFIFEGETTLDHRVVYEYSYRVLREDSRYRVKGGREWLITGYDATLWVDPKTAGLIRLRVRTDELPPATSLCQTDTTLDYGMVSLGEGDYLLPRSAKQRFIGREGGESENRLAFAGCREFRGESTVSFAGRRDVPSSSPPPAPRAPALPAGLPVVIDLVTEVHDDAAAGDGVSGRLAKPIRDAAGNVIVAEGAAAEGRLMRVEVRHGARPEAVVSLRWEMLDGHPVSLLPKRGGSSALTINGVGLRKRGVEIELPPAADVRYGVYHFKGERVAIAPGFRTEWTTPRP